MKIWAFRIEDDEDPYWGLFTEIDFAKKSAEAEWWVYVKDRQALGEWAQYTEADLHWKPSEKGIQLFIGEEPTANWVTELEVYEGVVKT